MDEQLDLHKLFAKEIQRELQEAREEQMNYQGILDLNRQTLKAEERKYASHTLYGTYTRRDYTSEVAVELRKRFKDLKRGKAMPGRSALVLLSKSLDWNRVAYIALSTMLDVAGLPRNYGRLRSKDKKDRGLVTTTELWLLVGKRILIEANLRNLRKTLPSTYKRLKEEFFTEHAGYEQRITNMKREVRSLHDYFVRLSAEPERSSLSPERLQEVVENFDWIEWSDEVRVQVGSLVARVVNDITGFFSESRSFNERGKTQNIFVFSKIYDEYRDEVMYQNKGFAFFPLPMLIPPKKWSRTQLGGYYASAAVLYKDGIVSGYRQGTEISDLTYEFINRQQDVGFSLDETIVELQAFLASKGWTILGEEEKYNNVTDAWRPYRRPDDWEIPKLPEHLQGVKKPTPDASDEHRELYNEKKAASKRIAQWHTKQEELKQRARPVERYLRIIRYLQKGEVFFFPWYLDWRGRCYPKVDGLNPQGPEYQKAALNFAEAVPVDDRTDFWLCVGIAGAAGQDKESFESRVAWTKQHLDLVKAVAKDPLGDAFKIWTNMPEPWIFLRACIEWYRINELGQTYTNIACLGMDATQSGLQLLGGMALCKQTCDLVNCVPGHDKPQDAYGTVLAEAIRLIEEDDGSFPVEKIRGKRKLVKTPVMTKVYAAGHDTRVWQIRNALAKEGIRLAKTDDRNTELIEYFTYKVEEAMLNTIPGVDNILSWFQEVVKTSLERQKAANHENDGEITYWTPSGNIVKVDYREAITKEVRTESLGTGMVKDQKSTITVAHGKTIVDDVVRAIAANFTHGAGDASLLHLAFHDTSSSARWVSTHDCVYAPPSRIVDDNRDRVREAFIKICEANLLQEFAERNGCADIPPPIAGTYRPSTVRRARYFFC
jgi:DNA-directed RNA polymerase, mitochondrial